MAAIRDDEQLRDRHDAGRSVIECAAPVWTSCRTSRGHRDRVRRWSGSRWAGHLRVGPGGAGRRPGAATYVRYPVVPGHEWSGTVVEVGPGADAALVGRKVVGEGFRSCLRCAGVPARRHEPVPGRLCRDRLHRTGRVGGLPHPARPAAARAARRRRPAGRGGAGTGRVHRVGVSEGGDRARRAGRGGRRGHARPARRATAGRGEPGRTGRRAHPAHAHRAGVECGATSLVTPDEVPGLAGRFDAVIEAAGAPGTARLATTLARRGGRVVLTGLPAADDDPPSPADIVLGELTVHSVFGASSNAWQHAVRAFTAGALRPGMLVTHEVGAGRRRGGVPGAGTGAGQRGEGVVAAVTAVDQVDGPVAAHGEGPVWFARLAGPALGRHAGRRRAGTVRRPARSGARTSARWPRRCDRSWAAVWCSRWSAVSRWPTDDLTGDRAAGRGVDRPGGADERGRLRPGRPVLLRFHGLRRAARRGHAVPAGRRRLRHAGADRSHDLQRPGLEPGRRHGVLRRHADRPDRRVHLRRRRTARPAARWCTSRPARADRTG